MIRNRHCAAPLLVVLLLAGGCATRVPGPVSDTATPAAPVAGEATAAPAAASPAPAITAPGSTPAEPVVQVSVQEFAERNDERLLQVYVGMSRQGVERLMGNLRAGPYSNPFRQQSFSLADGKHYEVLYYLTRAPRAGQSITETMLTPVILRQDRIVAIGRFPLKKLRRGECPGRPGSCP